MANIGAFDNANDQSISTSYVTKNRPDLNKQLQNETHTKAQTHKALGIDDGFVSMRESIDEITKGIVNQPYEKKLHYFGTDSDGFAVYKLIQ